MNFAKELRKKIDEEKAKKEEAERLEKEKSTNARLAYEKVALANIDGLKNLILKQCSKNNTGKLVVNSMCKDFEHYKCNFDTELILKKAGESLKQQLIEEGFRVTYEWKTKIGGKYLHYDSEGSGYDYEDVYGPQLTLEW